MIAAAIVSFAGRNAVRSTLVNQLCRGADPSRIDPDSVTLVTKVAELKRRTAPAEALALCERALVAHGARPPIGLVLVSAQAAHRVGQDARCAELLDLADALEPAPGQTALICLNRSVLARRAGDLDRAVDLLTEGIRAAQQGESPGVEAVLLGTLAIAYRRAGRTEEAIAIGRQTVAAFEAVGDRMNAEISRGNLAAALAETDPVAALAEQEAAVRGATELNDPALLATMVANLATQCDRLGRSGDAERHYVDATLRFRAIGDPLREGYCGALTGHLFHRLRRPEAAHRWFSEAHEALTSPSPRLAARLAAILAILPHTAEADRAAHRAEATESEDAGAGALRALLGLPLDDADRALAGLELEPLLQL